MFSSWESLNYVWLLIFFHLFDLLPHKLYYDLIFYVTVSLARLLNFFAKSWSLWNLFVYQVSNWYTVDVTFVIRKVFGQTQSDFFSSGARRSYKTNSFHCISYKMKLLSGDSSLLIKYSKGSDGLDGYKSFHHLLKDLVASKVLFFLTKHSLTSPSHCYGIVNWNVAETAVTAVWLVSEQLIVTVTVPAMSDAPRD